VQQLACDDSQKGRQGSPRRVELGGVMNEPYENILRNLCRLVSVTRHVERKPEHSRIVGPVEHRERVPVPFAKPFREATVGYALEVHAGVLFQKLGPHHGCTTILPPAQGEVPKSLVVEILGPPSIQRRR